MTSKELNISFLRQYILARSVVPLIACCAVEDARRALQNIGGMAGSWRTDYSECTYYSQQRVDGALVDLSTVENVRRHYEAVEI